MTSGQKRSGVRRWKGSFSAALVLLVAGCLLAACGGGDDGARPTAMPRPQGAASGPTTRRLDVDGTPRTYHLYVPASVGSGPAPLVLALHGAFNSAASMAQATQLNAAADANRFLVAYPEASGAVWNGGFCCTRGRGDPGTDVRFLDRLIDDAGQVHPIDGERVYAVGVSAGAVMAYRLGCDLAGRVAGVGSVAGLMLLDDCHPSEPVSVISINGTADQIVPIQGGRIRGGAVAPGPPAQAVAERWATLDTCPGSAQVVTDGPLTTTTWSDCAGGTSVRLVAVEGGGHNWYATEFGPPDGAIDATAAMLEFFGLLSS